MALSVDVTVPARGASAQAELCGVQWVLERRDAGVRCVAVDGEVLYEGLLGLPEGRVRLRVEACPPSHPIELLLDTDVVLAPGGAVRGYVSVPLHERLVGVGPAGEQVLVVLEDAELRAGWREGEGYHHPWHSPLCALPRQQPSARVLWLRVFLHNRGVTVVHPRRCRLALADQELHALRGHAVGPRVTWIFGEGGGVRMQPLPGRALPGEILAGPFTRLGEAAS